MANHVWPVDAVSGAPEYSGRMLRQSQMAPLLAGATTARPLGARSGVRPGTPVSTVTASASTWTVKQHAGVLDVLTAAEAGPYGYAVNSDVSGSITAANATNPRRDLVYIQLEDPAESTGGTSPSVTPKYLAGTAAASPAAPALPARSMVLAEINVPAAGGGSPTVSWKAPYSAAAGGVIPVRSEAERSLITSGTPENPVLVDRLDLGILERSVASGSWQSLTGSYTGTINVPAFSLPSGAGAVSLLPGTTIAHPFSGAVLVEASLAGDAVVGANTSVKFTLAVNTANRFSWVQNFSGGTVRDTPATLVFLTVPAGVAATVYVSASDVGSGGTSATAGSLRVDYVVRPA